jgi:hypothetical protein
VIGATARAAARRGSQDDHHGRAALDRGTAEQRHRVRVGGATSPVGTSCLGRPPKGAMLATTVTVRMRPARSTCNTALSAASLTYQPSTPSQTTSSGVLASSDRRRGWRLAGRRLGRPPARQSSAAMLSPRSRAGRVADHHAHPHRRRPWPPRSAQPGRRAAGRCCWPLPRVDSSRSSGISRRPAAKSTATRCRRRRPAVTSRRPSGVSRTLARPVLISYMLRPEWRSSRVWLCLSLSGRARWARPRSLGRG